jgi:hypothetical protein
MSGIRRLVDDATGTSLLYPDALSLFAFATSQLPSGRRLITFNARFCAAPEDLASISNSRQLRVIEPKIWFRAPNDPLVDSFAWVQTESLAAAIQIACAAENERAVLDKVKGFVSYLDPEYRGNSEEFTKLIDVARITLTREQIEEINQVKLLVYVVAEIVRLVQPIASDRSLQLVLSQRIVDKYSRVAKEGDQWTAQLPPEELSVAETRPMLSSELIFAYASDLKLRILP